MKIRFSLIAVLALLFVAWLGTGVIDVSFTHWVFGVAVPVLAALVFVVGFAWRIVHWAKSPVPFRIPTSCGQQKSLDWIKSSPLDNPHTKLGVVARMFLEVFLFRSHPFQSFLEVGGHGDAPVAGIRFRWSSVQSIRVPNEGPRHFKFMVFPVDV